MMRPIFVFVRFFTPCMANKYIHAHHITCQIDWLHQWTSISISLDINLYVCVCLRQRESMSDIFRRISHVNVINFVIAAIFILWQTDKNFSLAALNTHVYNHQYLHILILKWNNFLFLVTSVCVLVSSELEEI